MERNEWKLVAAAETERDRLPGGWSSCVYFSRIYQFTGFASPAGRGNRATATCEICLAGGDITVTVSLAPDLRAALSEVYPLFEARAARRLSQRGYRKRAAPDRRPGDWLTFRKRLQETAQIAEECAALEAIFSEKRAPERRNVAPSAGPKG